MDTAGTASSSPSAETAFAPPSGPPGAAPTVPPPGLADPDAASFAGGGLTALWRTLLGVAWLAAFFAYAAVWQASVQLGIGTWWIGPRAQPTPALVRLSPFIVCLAVMICVLYGVRRLTVISIVGAAVLLVGAVPDVSRSTSLAITEIVIALLLVAVSLLARSGRARR